MSSQPHRVVHGGGATREGLRVMVVEDLGKNAQRRSRREVDPAKPRTLNIIISEKAERIKGTSVKSILVSSSCVVG